MCSFATEPLAKVQLKLETGELADGTVLTLDFDQRFRFERRVPLVVSSGSRAVESIGVLRVAPNLDLRAESMLLFTECTAFSFSFA